MKKLLFILLLLSLQNQITFGMNAKEIVYDETSDWKRYYATLYNGDFITAYRFLNGPMSGKIKCSCITAKDNLGLHGFEIPSDGVYFELEKLYQSQNTTYHKKQ